VAPRFDLLILGDANPDLMVRGNVPPDLDRTEALVDRADLVIGGSGAIAACGAARLGLRVAFAGVVGDDVLGRFVRDSLAEREIDTTGLLVAPDRSTGLSIVLSGRGERTVLRAPGTMADLRAEVVDRSLVRDARHVHVSSYYAQTGLRPDLPGLFRDARGGRASTSIDPNWDPGEEWDGDLLTLLSTTDCFFPNSAEARAITGVDDIDVAAMALAERGTVVAVKFGQGGGLAVWGDEVVRSESIPTDVVDTTGAGASFDAGFLAGRLAGWPLGRCLQLAVACGSLSTRGVGGTAAQPTMEEALAALEAVA